MRIGNAMDFDRELNWQIFYTTVEGHNAQVIKLCVSKFDPPPGKAQLCELLQLVRLCLPM